jgi:glycosyltransferase involved in cell wall biosynthesis
MRMKETLVSIQMVTYNNAPYIAQAIEGVLRQKVDFPFELIIGEDSSSDGTRQIVFEYQRRHPDIIRVITSNKNVGPRENYRRVGEAGKGKYIAWCEGDDYWHAPNKLQKQVDYLESHPECGLVYSSFDIFHPKSNKRIKDFIAYRKWQMPEHPQITDFIEKEEVGLGILTCTIMTRRDLFMQILESDPYLHRSGKFLMGDTQIWAEMATKTQFHFIPESLATHNITEESVTRSKDIKKVLRFSISSSELGIYLCNKYGLPSNIRSICEAAWSDATLRLAFHSRNAGLANDVRRKKKTFTWQEWIRYYGSKNAILHFGVRMGSFFLTILRKEHNQWL